LRRKPHYGPSIQGTKFATLFFEVPMSFALPLIVSRLSFRARLRDWRRPGHGRPISSCSIAWLRYGPGCAPGLPLGTRGGPPGPTPHFASGSRRGLSRKARQSAKKSARRMRLSEFIKRDVLGREGRAKGFSVVAMGGRGRGTGALEPPFEAFPHRAPFETA